jgi:putative glutamate/gamma-aminobutyrate antiporter
MIESSGKQRRVLNIFILAMMNVSIMASLRNLPLVSEFGLSALSYFFIVALFFLVPCALVSAELATGWSKSGGVYVWVREGLGDRWGFMAIWMQWIHNIAWYPVIMSFVAVTLAYVISPELAFNKFYVLAIIIIGFWGMTFLNYLGIKTSGWFSTAGVIAGTIFPGLFIISLGISWIVGGHPIQTEISWSALLPSFNNLGNLVFLAGLFLAFAGLEVSASFDSDVENPQKNYPKAIILSALITFLLFMLGALSIAFVLPKEQISLVAGLMESFQAFFAYYHLQWALAPMAILLVIGAIAEVNSWIIGPVRGLHATSEHGNLPPIFQKLNKRQVPTNLLFFQAILVSITSLAFLYMPRISSAFWMLTALSAQSYLVMYILMFIAAIRLRYLQPHVPRAYRVPSNFKGIWILCCMGILSSCFAIFLCFVPPTSVAVGNPVIYTVLLAVGLSIMCALPLWISRLKKPEWRPTFLPNIGNRRE